MNKQTEAMIERIEITLGLSICAILPFVSYFDNPKTIELCTVLLCLPLSLKSIDGKNKILFWVLGAVAVVFTRAMTGAYLSFQFKDCSYVILLAVLFLYFYSLKTPQKFIAYIRPFLWFLIAVCLYKGFYQYFISFKGNINFQGDVPGLSEVQIQNIKNRSLQERIFSFFILPSIYAEFLLLSIFFIIVDGLRRKGISRYLSYALLGLCFVSLLMTRSVVGMTTGILALLVYVSLNTKNIKSMFIGIGIFLVIVGMIVFAILIRKNEYLKNPQNNPMIMRLMNWETALYLTSESPILGKGSGMFRIHYPRVMKNGASETRHVHSWYLETFSESGIFIVGGLLMVLFSLSYIIIKNHPSHLISISLLLFPIMNLYDLNFYMFSSAGMWMILIGLYMGHIYKPQVSYKLNRGIIYKSILPILIIAIFLKIWIGETYINTIDPEDVSVIREEIHKVNELAPYRSLNVFLEGYFLLSDPPSKEHPEPYLTGLKLIEKSKFIEPLQGMISYNLAREFESKHQYDMAYVESLRALRIYPERDMYKSINKRNYDNFYQASR